MTGMKGLRHQRASAKTLQEEMCTWGTPSPWPGHLFSTGHHATSSSIVASSLQRGPERCEGHPEPRLAGCPQGTVHPAHPPWYTSHCEWRGKCWFPSTLPKQRRTPAAQALAPAGQVAFKRASALGSKYLSIFVICF